MAQARRCCILKAAENPTRLALCQNKTTVCSLCVNVTKSVIWLAYHLRKLGHSRADVRDSSRHKQFQPTTARRMCRHVGAQTRSIAASSGHDSCLTLPAIEQVSGGYCTVSVASPRLRQHQGLHDHLVRGMVKRHNSRRSHKGESFSSWVFFNVACVLQVVNENVCEGLRCYIFFRVFYT